MTHDSYTVTTVHTRDSQRSLPPVEPSGANPANCMREEGPHPLHPPPPAAGRPVTDSTTSYPLLLWIEVSILLAVVLGTIALASTFPGRLGPLANVDHPPNPAKAPWYFAGLQELVSYSALWGGVVVPVSLLVVGALLPYVDRNPRGVGVWLSRHRRGILWLGAAATLAWVILTLVGAFARGPNWRFFWPGQPWLIPR